jgi:hypothetical protein
VRVDRLAGAGGLLFAAILVAQNVVRSNAPGFGATPAKVSAYFLHHRTPVLIPLGLFPIGMVGLLAFVAGVWTRSERGDSRWWANAGVLGATSIAGLFAVVNVTEIALSVKTAQLASSPSVVQALWALHAGAFGLDQAAIAVALVGLSRAAVASRLVPRWVGIVALPGAACLLTAATFTVALANGGPWIALALVGFAIWGVFVVAASVSLLRVDQ